jgi:hypothetical protein
VPREHAAGIDNDSTHLAHQDERIVRALTGDIRFPY